jgi:hypothetical protein
MKSPPATPTTAIAATPAPMRTFFFFCHLSWGELFLYLLQFFSHCVFNKVKKYKKF